MWACSQEAKRGIVLPVSLIYLLRDHKRQNEVKEDTRVHNTAPLKKLDTTCETLPLIKVKNSKKRLDRFQRRMIFIR